MTENMTITIRARFDGKVLIPEQPVSLPTDQPLEIAVRVPEATPSDEAYAPLYQLIGLVEQEPEDASIRHDEL
ncbi:MAG: hypothetical protein RMK45_08515 [Armatimonadota bacterium]|nr:hypothetical protein [Armatimonadota bacterium]